MDCICIPHSHWNIFINPGPSYNGVHVTNDTDMVQDVSWDYTIGGLDETESMMIRPGERKSFIFPPDATNYRLSVAYQGQLCTLFVGSKGLYTFAEIINRGNCS